MPLIDAYRDSRYNPNLEIVEQEEERGPARLLLADGILQSGVWLDPAIRWEPVLGYARRLREVVAGVCSASVPREVLVLGGAGLETPRFLLRNLPGAHITVVELDPVMKEVAERHFFLEELEGSGRLTLVIGDAVRYLRDPGLGGGGERDGAYDLIINDAFCALRAETALLTAEACRRIGGLLKGNGSYLINLITALSGRDSWPLRAEREILGRFFGSVRAYPTDPGIPEEKLQNCILAAGEPGHLH